MARDEGMSACSRQASWIEAGPTCTATLPQSSDARSGALGCAPAPAVSAGPAGAAALTLPRRRRNSACDTSGSRVRSLSSSTSALSRPTLHASHPRALS